MALADYHLCAVCEGKAFYDANVTDPGYCATYDTDEDCDPIGIKVLCSGCAKSHEIVVRPIGERE